MQVFGACGEGYFSRSGLNIIDDGALEPGNPEVKAFGQDGVLLNATNMTKENGSMTTFYSEQGFAVAVGHSPGP